MVVYERQGIYVTRQNEDRNMYDKEVEIREKGREEVDEIVIDRKF